MSDFNKYMGIFGFLSLAYLLFDAFLLHHIKYSHSTNIFGRPV